MCPHLRSVLLICILPLRLTELPANEGGNGRHMQTLTKDEFRKYSLVREHIVLLRFVCEGLARLTNWQALFIFEQTFGVAIFLVKISVLLLYRRIFETQQFRRHTLIVGILTLLWLLVKNLVGAFQCTPVRKAWEKSIPGHCPVNFIHNVLGAQAFNVLFDIVILALPIAQLYKLQLPLYKKIGVMAIFAVGIL